MKHYLYSLIFVLLLISCDNNQNKLIVLSHNSFNVSTKLIAEFEKANKIKVQILKSGDAGSALNRAILSKNNPEGDVFFGIDNTYLTRALKENMFLPYAPQGLKKIPKDLQLDAKNRLIPIDHGYVCLNYDKKYFQKNKLPLPTSLKSLTKPIYKAKLVVENPATSSPGLAFMLTTISHFGTNGDYTWLEFWRDLRKNKVKVVDSWDQAYHQYFSGAANKGPCPLVLSYTTSPPAQVYYSYGKLKEAETASLLLKEASFHQIEFAGILRGTKKLKIAQKWMDFMLSKKFQEDIPLNMFVYPALPEAKLPELFIKFSPLPKTKAPQPSPHDINDGRRKWIKKWDEVVLR